MLLDFHRMQSYADTEELGEAERAAAAVRQSIAKTFLTETKLIERLKAFRLDPRYATLYLKCLNTVILWM